MVKVNDDGFVFDLFNDNLYRAAVFALTVERHAGVELDTCELVHRYFLLRFRIVLAVGVGRLDDHCLFVALPNCLTFLAAGPVVAA